MPSDFHHPGMDVLDVVKRTITTGECMSPLTCFLLRPRGKLTCEPDGSLERELEPQRLAQNNL